MMNYSSFSNEHTAVFLDYFFNPEFYLAGLLHLFFIECFKNLFTVEITNNIGPWYSVLQFLEHKDFLRPTWSLSLCKNILVFWYSRMVINLRSLSLCSTPYSIYVPHWTTAAFIVIDLWYVLLYLSTISSSLLMHTFVQMIWQSYVIIMKLWLHWFFANHTTQL